MRASLVCLVVLLGLSSLVSAQKADAEKATTKHVFTRDTASLNYRLFVPPAAKKKAKQKYPLVVLLHGSGERGDDNTAQLVHGVGDFISAENQKAHPCFLIAPQCPKDQGWAPEKGKAPKAKGDNGDLVLALIESLMKEYTIDPNRIYLTGLSMGGHGAWELLCRKPDLFAAGIPICGRGDVAKADKLAKLPIWTFHGDKDMNAPVKGTRDMVEAIKKAGGKPKYTEYPGVEHDCWTQTYRDAKVHEWLFAQKKGG